MSDTKISRRKTWIYYLVQFLIFGPMLGLMVFAIFITRDQSIPVLTIGVAGTSVGVVFQLIILRNIYKPKRKPLILGGCTFFAFLSLVFSIIYLGLHSVLHAGIIAMLFVAYSVFLRLRSATNT